MATPDEVRAVVAEVNAMADTLELRMKEGVTPGVVVPDDVTQSILGLMRRLRSTVEGLVAPSDRMTPDGPEAKVAPVVEKAESRTAAREAAAEAKAAAAEEKAPAEPKPAVNPARVTVTSSTDRPAPDRGFPIGRRS